MEKVSCKLRNYYKDGREGGGGSERSVFDFIYLFFLFVGDVSGLKKVAFGEIAVCVVFTRRIELFTGGR
jgi:hypothetical protein